MSDVMREDILVPLFVFSMVVLIVWLRFRLTVARAGIRAESQKHLVDKFGSGRELAEFVESEGGRRFLEELTAKPVDPAGRVLNLVKAGLILATLGVGFLVLMVREVELIYPGVIVLALGIGFLIAAWVSHRLSKKWGVPGQNEPGTEGPREG